MENQPQNELSASVIVDRRFSNYFERIAIGLISFVITVMFLAYQSHQSDFKELEARVLTIQMDKVSRSDLNDVEARINKNFDARIGELISRSTSDKQDILARLDLYFQAKKQ